MRRGTTAAKVWKLPQAKVPSLICTKSTRAIIRNPHPNTDPSPENSMPNLSTAMFTCPWWTATAKAQPWPALMACLRASAMRLEKRKELKE